MIDDDNAARKIWRVVEQLDLSRFASEVRAVEERRRRVVALAAGAGSGLDLCLLQRPALGPRDRAPDALRAGPALADGLNPVNHHTLSDFRAGQGEALRQLFEQVLALLTMKGPLTLERIAVHGTKIRADVGKKSFTKRNKIEDDLKLACEHLDELERQESDER